MLNKNDILIQRTFEDDKHLFKFKASLILFVSVHVDPILGIKIYPEVIQDLNNIGRI